MFEVRSKLTQFRRQCDKNNRVLNEFSGAADNESSL